ncbi:MAG: DUF6458 family protein [Actinomycetota bacterium]|jgi:tellurite resistance protein TehA-like permease|nr:DUF6458 family protein [Actinomycetota bacterium]
MGIGTSLTLIAVGAILAFAVNAEIGGIELDTVGVILMIVGALGLVISLLFLLNSDRRSETVVRRDRFDREPPY